MCVCVDPRCSTGSFCDCALASSRFPLSRKMLVSGTDQSRTTVVLFLPATAPLSLSRERVVAAGTTRTSPWRVVSAALRGRAAHTQCVCMCWLPHRESPRSCHLRAHIACASELVLSGTVCFLFFLYTIVSARAFATHCFCTKNAA